MCYLNFVILRMKSLTKDRSAPIQRLWWHSIASFIVILLLWDRIVAVSKKWDREPTSRPWSSRRRCFSPVNWRMQRDSHTETRLWLVIARTIRKTLRACFNAADSQLRTSHITQPIPWVHQHVINESIKRATQCTRKFTLFLHSLHVKPIWSICSYNSNDSIVAAILGSSISQQSGWHDILSKGTQTFSTEVAATRNDRWKWWWRIVE